MKVALRVLDVRLDICLPSDAGPELRDRVVDAWRHCLTDAAEEAARRVDWRGPDTATGMHLLSQDVTRAAIDERAGQAVMLHAAAIADPESGAAVAAVGASGAGKTTWVTTHGKDRRYISDETVLIAGDGQITGVPKPLSIGHRTVKEQRPPDDFGLLMADGTERVAQLWILDRNGTAPARLTEVEILDALPLLAQQASYLAALPRPLHQLAAVVEACGGLKRAENDEAADLNDLISQALA